MRDSTLPRSHCPTLPSGQAQAVARPHVHHGAMPMLLASALAWAAVWGLWQGLPQSQPVQAPQPVAMQPLPVKTLGQPTLGIALAEAPKPVAPARKQQRMKSDLLALFGHVAGELVRDELDTMVLRLSLGQQVAVRLRQELQQ